MFFSTGIQLAAALNALPPSKQGSFLAFDADFYAQRYMGAYTGNLTPIDHFVQIGAKSNFHPNALFDAAFYKSQYADLTGTQFDGADLLYHFMRFGLDEGRAPNAEFVNFNGATYLANNPDVAAYVNANLAQFGGSATNGAIAHFVKFGMAEGRVAPLFTASVDSPSVTEGNDGTSTLSFKVTLDHAPTSALTLNVATNGVGTTASAGSDYIPVAQTVTFAAGQTVAFVNVTVNGDTVVEANETLKLAVTGQALTAAASGTGTILNDDVANRAPVATNITVGGHEDAAITGSVFAADADGDAVAYSLVSGPAHGALVLNADGSYTYTPNANFNGVDSFTYKANDGTVDGNTATVSLTVAAVNDAPVAQGVVAQGLEDAAKIAVTPVAADIDAGDTLTYSVNSQPSNGTVSFNAATGKFDYVPNANFNGTDSFTYKVTDAAGATSVATASVTVTAVNDAPVANDAAASGNEDTVIAGSVSATDVEGSALNYSVVAGPAHGTLVLDANGSYTYTPNANFNGADSFTYKANDGTVDGNTATVSLTVAAVNDAPVATAIQAAATEDVAQLNGNLATAGAATDIDSASLTFSLVSGAPGFSLAANGAWTFNPAAAAFQHLKHGEVTNVTATYQVTDGALSATSTATFTVTGTNDLPVATNVTVSGYENLQVTGQVTATDVDGDTLTYAVSNAKNGEVVLDAATGNYVFTPAANFNGVASFDYTANDGTGNSVVRTVTINVTDVVNVLTEKQDLITLVNAGAAEAVRGANHNLGQGDVITGGAEDSLVLSIDNGSGNFDWYVNPQNDFASFSIQGVGTFQVTNDDTDLFHRPANFDMSSSDGVQTLVSENSTYDVRFNYANLNDDGHGGQFVNLQARNLTDGVNVTLDVRNGDVNGENDTVNLLVTDSDDDSLDAASINITAAGTGPVDQNTDAGIEVVNLSTGASTGEVRINDLNTPGAHTLNIDTHAALVIGDLDDNLGAIENALSATVLTVDAEGSTGNIALSTQASIAGATITGGSGSDTFFTSNTYGDSVTSGAGDDDLYVGGGGAYYGGGNWVDAGTGNDFVTTAMGEDGENSYDTIYGGTGNDTIEAGDGNNFVYGEADDDLITVGEDNDSVDGGSGDDIINIQAGGNDNVLGGSGNDTVNAGSNLSSAFTERFGNAGGDTLNGGEGTDTLNFSANNNNGNILDRVTGFENIVIADGTKALTIEVTDTSPFDTDTTATTIDASAMNDSFTFKGNDLSPVNDVGDEPLDSTSDDVLSRSITILGGSNNDSIVTGLGSDSIRGNAGNDTIESGSGNDTIDGAVDNDSIEMGAGNDKLVVLDEQLTAGDTVAGGLNDDTIELIHDGDDSNSGTTATTDATLQDVTGIETLLVTDNATDENGVVNVTFTAAYQQTSITVDGRGLSSGDVLHVDTSAQDVDIDGVVENFTILGGAGNDTFNMGDNLGGDSIDGNGGTADTIVFNGMVVDTDFVGVTEVEVLTMTGPLGDSATLGSNARDAGIRTVNGTDGADTVDAHDYTVGLSVEGGAGNDTIRSGDGNDTINAGAGSDSIVAGKGNDLVINDTLEFVADNISLGEGNDTLRVYGNGVIDTFGPLDTVAGGTGTDTVELVNSLGAVTAFVNLDNVTSVERYVTVDQNRESVDTAYNFAINFMGGSVTTMNYITVDASSLTDDDGDTLTVDLSGLGDKDFTFNITGGDHGDTVIASNLLPEDLNFSGGKGNDRLVISALDVGGSVVSDGGADIDTLAINSALGVVSDDTFVTLHSYEVLTVTGAANAVNAQLGAAAEAAGLLTVIGGSGNDNVVLDAEFTPDNGLTVDLSAGGNDTINGGASATAVTFKADAADINLSDVVTGGTSAGDKFMLTADNSVALVGNVTGVETFTVVEGKDAADDFSIGLTVTDHTFTGVDGGVITVDARALNDVSPDTVEGGLTLSAGTVTGSHAFNVHGGTGNDSLVTGAGDDSIAAGEGNDTVSSGLGNDSIDAGNGNNTVAAGDGNNSVTAGTGNDTISSGTGNDTISSGNGNDSITSGAGNDSVDSGEGDDIAVLGAGNDTFVGGAGSDTVTGGGGADSLTGGEGVDYFRYTDSTDSNGSLVPLNRDTITDFVSGTDKIELTFGLNVFFAGNGATFADVQGAVALTAGNGKADYVFEQDNHRLWIDVNDDGVLNGLDLQITLTGVNTIAAGDVVNPV